MLLPNQKIADIVRQILSDERAASLSQAKAVAEYWLWGPYNVALSSDRQTSLQRYVTMVKTSSNMCKVRTRNDLLIMFLNGLE